VLQPTPWTKVTYPILRLGRAIVRTPRGVGARRRPTVGVLAILTADTA